MMVVPLPTALLDLLIVTNIAMATLALLASMSTRRVLDYVESLPRQPSADDEGGAALARSLAEPLPETGRSSEELLDLLFDRVVRKGFGTAGPGYLAYIPGGGIVHSAVADFVADAVNRYVGVFAAAPGVAQIETNVVRWFADIVGYPDTAGGILTTGGSLANFSALVTARRERLPDDFLAGILYASDQTHHSIAKAAILAGFPEENVRSIPSDPNYRLRIDVLADAISLDRKAGRRPFFVTGNAGTTNTGAVDDLDALADFCADENLWFHVDAAYGGFFLLTDFGRRALHGISRADSIVLDPHKGLFLPSGTGSLLVRDCESGFRSRCTGSDLSGATSKRSWNSRAGQPTSSDGFRASRSWPSRSSRSLHSRWPDPASIRPKRTN